MYAQLGNVQFEVLPVTSLEEKYSYNYAVHPVIEGKPLLQFIGDNLDECTLGIRLHFSFCDPATAFAALKAEADSHRALPFRFNDGSYLGRFVVCEISKTLMQTADSGRPLCIEAQVSLKEWVDSNPLGSAQAAQQQSAPGLTGKGPIGKVTPQPRGTVVMAAGMVKAKAQQIGRDAAGIQGLTTQFTSPFSTVAAEVTAKAAQIRAQVAPVMAQAQALAAGVSGAAASLQSQVTAISGFSSDIARITSGLPYPASIVGTRIAAINQRISSRANDGITLTSLTLGGAIEAGTRARMIARLLPQ